MDHRSPLENIFNIISGLPQGHDKPVKHAFYNALAIFLLVLCCAAGWALYIILEPFIKPLIWALLVGSVLHPLKHKLAYLFRSWFDSLESARTPIMLGIILLPINIVNNMSEFIGSKLLKHIKIIMAVTITVPAVLVIYYYTPKVMMSIVLKLGCFSAGLITFLIDNATATQMLILLVAYITSMLLLWGPENNIKFHIASTVIWLIFCCFLSHQFGSFQIAVFMLLLLVIIGGFVYEIYSIQEDLSTTGQNVSIFDVVKYAFNMQKFNPKEVTNTNINEEQRGINDLNECMEEKPEKPDSKVTEKEVKAEIHKHDEQSIEGSNISTQSQKNPWTLELFESTPKKSVEENVKKTSSLNNTSLVITDQGNIHVLQPIEKSVIFTKEKPKFKRSFSQSHLGLPLLKSKSSLFGLRKRSELRSFSNISQKSENDEYASDFYIYSLLWACGIMLLWKNVMLLPILPIPILIYFIKHIGLYLGLWELFSIYWNKAMEYIFIWCKDRYDALVPIPIRGLYRIIYKANISLKNGVKESIDTVASCVVIFGLIIFVLCASIFVAIQVYAEAIMLVQMTSNVINQTVVHNPELRQLLPPTFDDTVDSILDNAYQYGREGISKTVRGMMSDVDTAKSEKLEKQVLELWDRIYQTWMSTDDASAGPKVTSSAIEHSWKAFLDDIQKSPELFNINGIVDFMKQNVGTLMSLLDSVWAIVKGNIGLVLGSFSAFVSVLLGGGTAVLNFILNMIIFLTTLFYLLSSSGDLYKPVELMTNFSSNGSRFGLALGGAVNSVFTASFKMSVFYGMWTWFIHNLFGVKIVYLPSAFAAILAAAPFLGTYWACIPAVLDLWLSQEKGFQAILFAVFQFLPTSIVDGIIYSEIQGGHPYLTGLAIAGGIFCLGLEGAIVGPLLLCGLYVAMDLSTTFFRDSPSEESINLPQLSR